MAAPAARLTDEELAEWGQEDPYNSILQRRRFPRLIAELRASRAEVGRLQAENARLRSDLDKAQHRPIRSAHRVDL